MWNLEIDGDDKTNILTGAHAQAMTTILMIVFPAQK